MTVNLEIGLLTPPVGINLILRDGMILEAGRI
jgi:TRAP-type C4-dicarboxylate transport system permease large subunit